MMENWKRHLREKIVEPSLELQEKIRQYWLTLKPRERLTISLLAGFMLLSLFILAGKETIGFLYKQESLAKENMQNIDRIQQLSDVLLGQRSSLFQFEKLINRRGETFNLKAFLESEAQNSGVQIDKFNPTRPRLTTEEPKGKVAASKEDESDEDWFEVKLKDDATLNAVLRFLEKIDETIGLNLVELSIKPQFTDRSRLEVLAVIANKKNL